MFTLQRFVALLSTLLLSVEGKAASLVITGIHLAPDGLVLAGTGGSNSATFRLLAATNLSLAMTNWSTVATNQFDTAGNFNFTNPISSGTSRVFYRIEIVATLNDSNNYSLFGFGAPATGGGLLPETDPN